MKGDVMSEINESTLKSLQTEWRSVQNSIHDQEQYSNLLSAVHKIHSDLKDLCLDLGADETYELLGQGVDRDTFQKIYKYLLITDCLSSYRNVFETRANRYVGQFNGKKQFSLELVFERLDDIAQRFTDIGLPEFADPLLVAQYEQLVEFKDSGLLQKALDKAVLDNAADTFRTVISYYNEYQAEIAKARQAIDSNDYEVDGANDNRVRVRSAAQNCLSNIKKIEEDVKKYPNLDWADKSISKEYNKRSLYGWSDEKTLFSLSKIRSYKDELILKQIEVEFEWAKKFYDQGIHVLDTSGGGYGALVLPIQKVLLDLQEAGFDIHSDESFEKIGTDKKTVWEMYKRERQSVLDSGEHKRLVKPAL